MRSLPSLNSKRIGDLRRNQLRTGATWSRHCSKLTEPLGALSLIRVADGGLFVARFFADGSAGLGIDQMDLAAGVIAYGLERVVGARAPYGKPQLAREAGVY